ncbi:hypothetical protein HJC23_001484 [Cyclotella cryptica]|uniref:DM2 domain-containing protein n=1 Tax=Cyclotella cryptica TaxID=29204 RepID=A0ABD3NZS7_9STRA|eukprot:CCRYP_018538-RA/>CCRYP_018538-RA protein AED:0.35 eAED:0.35 QI:0/-1/0/1/-1/1/1/0/622
MEQHSSLSASYGPSSSLPDIYESHRTILQRLDDLESRLAFRVAAHRRHAANLLEETPTHRRTHMRIFVSHRVDDQSSHVAQKETKATSTLVPPPAPKGGKDFSALLSAAAAHHVLPQKKSIRKWTLVVEGGLLIKHLDHESAKEVDRRWDSDLPILGQADEKCVDDSLRATKSEIPQREQWQGGRTDKENDVTIEPLIFTHLFEKIEVEMKPVKQSSSEEVAGATVVEERDIRQSVTTFTWERVKSDTPDSHAFFIVFNEEGFIPISDPSEKSDIETPKADYNSDYISAKIKLFRRQGDEGNYVPSEQLCEVFFPTFLGKKTVSQGTKRKASDLSNESQLQNNAPKDVIIPNTLTMDEVLRAIFFYIRTRNLQDATDLSIINNDDTLSELFGCNRMLLSEVKRIMLEKALLVKVEPGSHPIIFNYKMTLDGADPVTEEGSNVDDKKMAPVPSAKMSDEATTRRRSSNDAEVSRPVKEKDEDSTGKKKPKNLPLQTMLSCDVDIEVPNLFHLRTRDILRRIKYREFEYTSCRYKAKNALVATKVDEETAKLAVEDAITGKGYVPHFKQVWMALAKGSHEGGEAQRAALIELRTTSLMEKLEERSSIAREYWDVVEACRGLTEN